ncbi:MAG: aminopeptidase P family protein [Prevotellaceae bacterium]|jgi:Xaa-Pro aminopeptidase|nr:aminopeptidase P family protein [Prevotellaceae bacterium]
MQKEIYEKRRTALRKSILSGGVVIFPSNNDSPMNYPANTYRYRQDSNFAYFFGKMRDGLVGVIDLDSQTDLLFGDSYTIDDIIWMGNQPSVEELAAASGIHAVRPKENLSEFIKNALVEGRNVHYLPPFRDDTRLFLSRIINIPVEDVKNRASQELIEAVVDLRLIKDEEEIAEMDAICDTGVEMHLSVIKNCRPGVSERLLAGMAEGIALSYGAGVSFPIILSQNGETLHNHDHSQILTAGRLLLADMGAESVSGYSSDFTRTVPVSGKFSEEQLAIYNIVLRANLESIGMARVGIPYRTVHNNACTVIAEGLGRLGLMKGDPVAAVEAGAHALFMPHGLGHALGMDVHDMEGLGENNVGYDSDIRRSDIFGHSSLRFGRTLREGHIVTVEPGIYFIPQLIDLWASKNAFSEYINYDRVRKYIGFGGIRIEDDILITADGCRILGKALPKFPEEIENLMARATN